MSNPDPSDVPPPPPLSPLPPPAPSPSSTPDGAWPPGWYHDGVASRWWDGSTWGPVAPQASSSSNGLATFAHLGFVVGGFILPLVIYLSSKPDEQPEVRYHAREALNHQLTVMLASFLSVVVGVGGVAIVGAVGASSDPGSGAGIGVGIIFFFGFFALIFAIVIGSIVLSIIAAVRANKGERYRYPLCIRFVRS